jgi:hypothetical protein
MSRSGVLALAVVVLGGLGALWYFAIRDDAPAAPPAEPAASPTAEAPRATGPAPTLAPSTTGPILKSSGRPVVPPDTSEMEVRDHRPPSTGEPIAGDKTTGDPIPIQPGQLSPVASRALFRQASAPAQECGRLIQPSDRGAKPRLGARLKLAVKAGAMRVLEVEPVAEDVTGADIDAAKKCVREALLGTEMAAPDTPESDAVAMDLSFIIR